MGPEVHTAPFGIGDPPARQLDPIAWPGVSRPRDLQRANTPMSRTARVREVKVHAIGVVLHCRDRGY